MFSSTRASTVEAILRDLNSQNLATRIAAAKQAYGVAHEYEEHRSTIISALITSFELDSVPLRMAIVYALADLKAHEALPTLWVASNDDNPIVAQCAIHAMGEIADPSSYERIRAKVDHENPAIRYQAVVAAVRLAQVCNDVEYAWALLVKALDDEDADVRSRAADTVAELAQGALLPMNISDRLSQLSESLHEPNHVRVAAAIALAESKDLRAKNVLLSIMRGEFQGIDPNKVQAAFELAGELAIDGVHTLASKAAFGVLSRLGEPSRRLGALVALLHFNDSQAQQFVLKQLSSRSFTQRALAIGVVSRAAFVEAKPLLEALRNKPDLADPEVVEEALDRIQQAQEKRDS